MTEFDKRKETYISAFLGEHLQTFLTTHLPDVRYLCGFTGSNGNILLLEETGYFFTDFRYKEQAGREVKGLEVVVYAGGLGQALAEVLEGREATAVGFDPATLTFAEVTFLRKALRGVARTRPIKFSPALLRARKSAAELEIIKRALHVAEKALLEALAQATPDMSEMDFALELDMEARRRGAEARSFETIVASGSRGSLVHATPTRKKLKGATVIDWGVIVEGYCTDMTRTISFGEASSAMKKIHSLVLEAQEAAIKKIKPGVRASDVDAAAREVIDDEGYAEYFGHATGHGVGLEVHERPYVAKTSRDVLEEGMVFTVEPGIYLPGKGGVRIEDMVAVTAAGAKLLSQLPRDLAPQAYI